MFLDKLTTAWSAACAQQRSLKQSDWVLLKLSRKQLRMGNAGGWSKRNDKRKKRGGGKHLHDVNDRAARPSRQRCERSDFPTLKKKAENNFCVLLLLNSATMNIAFSFALVYSHVLDLSLCLSCLLAQRASENKAHTAYFFFLSLIPMDVFVCCTATSKTPGKHQKGLSIRGVNKTLTLLEMKWREKKKKNVRGEFKNRMKIYRSVFLCSGST